MNELPTHFWCQIKGLETYFHIFYSLQSNIAFGAKTLFFVNIQFSAVYSEKICPTAKAFKNVSRVQMQNLMQNQVRMVIKCKN